LKKQVYNFKQITAKFLTKTKKPYREGLIL